MFIFIIFIILALPNNITIKLSVKKICIQDEDNDENGNLVCNDVKLCETVLTLMMV